MGWRDRYRPASIDGIEFKVKTNELEFGRRTVDHEYPQKDEAWIEDMGKAQRRFTFDGFVLGADYDQVRDRLIEALEKPGPYVLVHPSYGRRIVRHLSKPRCSENPSDEGGKARFSFDFGETADNVQPETRADTQSQVNLAADDATAAAEADFAEGFSVDGMPDFVSASALESLNGVMGSLDAARMGMVPDLSILSAYTSTARGVSGSLSNLIRSPGLLAGSILGLFSGLRGLALGPLSALTSLRSLFGFGRTQNTTVPRTTPSRIQEANNQVAVNQLVERAAVIEAVRASTEVEFESYDQAVKLRDELGDRIDEQLEAPQQNTNANPATTEAVYVALVRLRAAMVRDITERGGDLAQVRQVALPATVPSLVAAYRLYGSSAREADLVTRNPNKIRHPGFVPGGTELEVLRN